MATKQKCLIGTFALWGTLGFVRGIQSYNFETFSMTSLYTDKVFNGLFGAIVYINPVTGIFMFYKEMYRLEVNLFNIKREKESNFYNKLLM
jgi:hypothetical protein